MSTDDLDRLKYRWTYQRRRHDGVLHLCDDELTLADAKANVEGMVKEHGKPDRDATVVGPRGRWAYRSHARIAGRMVWKRIEAKGGE